MRKEKPMPNTIHIATPAQPKARKPKAAKAAPTQEEIQLRAYQIYLERNGAPGNPFDDWTQAEQELAAKKAKSSRGAKIKAA
jgi:hypothetical protein